MQKTKAGRLALLTLLSLLTTSWLGCCLCKVPDRATIQADANRLDGWRGELQLVVPAEREPRGGILSPNGRWMLVYLGFFGHPKQWILLDLAMGTERDLESRSGYFRWLEDDLFTHGGGIINATDLTTQPLEWREDEPELLADAKVIYAMPHPGRGGYCCCQPIPIFPTLFGWTASKEDLGNGRLLRHPGNAVW